MRGDEHCDPLLPRDPRQEIDNLLLAGDVQVREWFVEQEQAWAADQRVRDEDPLLLTTGEVPDTRVRESHGVHRLEHRVDLLATR